MKKVTKKFIAQTAFLKLREEKKFEAAARLAHSLMFGGGSIVLSVNDTDWDIQTAIEYVAGETSKLFGIGRGGNSATFSFDYEIEITEEQCDKIDKEFYN